MKNYQVVLIAITSIFLSSSCSDSKPIQMEAKSTTIENTPVASVENSKVKSVREEMEVEVGPNLSNYTATCGEKEEKNPESEDPTIIKTCTFRNYKTILIGNADYKGRYSWEYNLYKTSRNEDLKIDNTLLFNQKQSDLLKQVNRRIKADYLMVAGDPENKDCFEGVDPIHDFEMNELGIQFETDKLVFHVEYGLPSACLAVDGTSISFTLKELEPYLNK
jgi:hypothetical protein